jgi:dGTPase
MAIDLGLNADMVDMACLAHDLGHPPFGHNGERAVNDWAANIGGFEGNAQTLRLLTRIEPKVFSADGTTYGLNLTRASLDATCKYPWSLHEASADVGADQSIKFGVYQDDMPVFEWLRSGAPSGIKCVEAQVMDFADDVAYSVHDFEDAVVSGFVDLRALADFASERELLRKVSSWSGGVYTEDQLAKGLHDLRSSPYWLTAFESSSENLGTLKNLSSDLIGRFVGRTIQSIIDTSPADSMARFGAMIDVPESVKIEIAVLKGIVSAFLMSHESRRPFYEWQRALLTELADALLAANGQHLDAYCRSAWSQARTEQQQRRVIVDQVASLTDQSALSLHNQLVTGA